MYKPLLALVLCVTLLIPIGCDEPTWVQTALADLPEIITIVSEVLPLITLAAGASPQDVQFASTIGTEIATDIGDVKAAVTAYNSAPASEKANLLGKIEVAIAAAQGNLGSLLRDAHVKDANTLSAVTESIQLALEILNDIQSNLPASSMASIHHQLAVAIPIPKKEEIDRRLTSIFLRHRLPMQHAIAVK